MVGWWTMVRVVLEDDGEVGAAMNESEPARTIIMHASGDEVSGLCESRCEC